MPLRAALRAVTATPDEVRAPMAGDDLIPQPDAVMDRAFTVPGTPDDVWPWVVQLGKGRAGWYLPRGVERVVPRERRASRRIEGRWQGVAVGDVVPDYGGARATFTAAVVERPHHLVYTSQRGATSFSWSIGLAEVASGVDVASTRVHLRLRLGPLRRPWLADTLGDAFDLITIAGLAAGLDERLRP